jgi:hypothetical protein
MHRTDNLTTFMCRLSRNSGASTSGNLKDLARPVAGKLYLSFTLYAPLVSPVRAKRVYKGLIKPTCLLYKCSSAVVSDVVCYLIELLR